MNKGIIAALASFGIAAAVCTGTAIAYYHNDNTNEKIISSSTNSVDSAREERLAELETEKQAAEKELDKEIDNQSNSNETNSHVRDEIDEKREALIDEEEEKKKADLEAYSILAKYYGDEYMQNEIITDYDLDLSYMKSMCELLNKGKLDDSEKEVLVCYVKRRTSWITDESLRESFEKEVETQ